MRHLLAGWPTFTSEHVADEIFFDVMLKVLHTGIFYVGDCYLFVLKRDVLLCPDPCILLLFPWYSTSGLICCTTISSVNVLSSLPVVFLPFGCRHIASNPPCWQHAYGGNYLRCLGRSLAVAALGHAKIYFHFPIESKVNFSLGRALPLALFCILLSECIQFKLILTFLFGFAFFFKNAFNVKMNLAWLWFALCFLFYISLHLRFILILFAFCFAFYLLTKRKKYPVNSVAVIGHHREPN